MNTEEDLDDEDWLLDDETVAEGDRPVKTSDERPWRVLIVDDDRDVHSVTRLALSKISYKGRELELISAYSGKEGFGTLRDIPDIALVLLDVVMESEDAGLILAKRLREELGNHLVRVVLRTGQPGQAPEQSVIVDYDINDYKAKTELTTQKLFTVVVASLRAYESLQLIERSRNGLVKILDGATNLYQIHSLRAFAAGVLDQISAILDVGTDAFLCVLRDASVTGESLPTVVAATGSCADLLALGFLPADHALAKIIDQVFIQKKNYYSHPVNVIFIRTRRGNEFAIWVSSPWPIAEYQRDLLEIFSNRIAAAFDNLYLFDQVRKTQVDAMRALADLAGE